MPETTTHAPQEVPPAVHPTRHLAYMVQACPMTVREGLEEYYGTIDGLITEDNASKEVADLFRYHDTCHVVFGCDTSPIGETLADTWSIFGSDVSLKTYARYFQLQETQDLFQDIGVWRSVRIFASALPIMPRAYGRTRRMTKRWPFHDHEAYLDRPLAEVRAEFGIEVFEL